MPSIRSHSLHRQRCSHSEPAGIRRPHLQASVQCFDAFAHPFDAETSAEVAVPTRIRPAVGFPVENGDLEPGSDDRDGDRHRGAGSMPQRIRQTLLHDAERREARRRRQ